MLLCITQRPLKNIDGNLYNTGNVYFAIFFRETLLENQIGIVCHTFQPDSVSPSSQKRFPAVLCKGRGRFVMVHCDHFTDLKIRKKNDGVCITQRPIKNSYGDFYNTRDVYSAIFFRETLLGIEQHIFNKRYRKLNTIA